MAFDDTNAVDEGLAFAASDPDLEFAAAVGSGGDVIALRQAPGARDIAPSFRDVGVRASSIEIADDVTEIAGRGVGLAAVHASVPGNGTRFTFRFARPMQEIAS
jgi:hypothetical protein